MAIPDYESIMTPLMRALADGKERKLGDLVEALSTEFGLSEDERQMLLPSATAPVFGSRVGWAKTYLKQAGLVEQPRRGVVRLSDRGRSVLAGGPAHIDNALLDQFQEFRDFRSRSKKDTAGARGQTLIALAAPLQASPEESIEVAVGSLEQALITELLDAMSVMAPSRFESLVVQLLLKMGYGGSRQEAGQAVGKSGDGGIDGMISEDRLGLEAIYVQAKRWKGTVGEPEVRNFLGALVGRGANKGVFMTTGAFSDAAHAFAGRSIQQKIVLIDGQRLAKLMIEHDLGVTTAATYAVKRLDSDFFSEE